MEVCAVRSMDPAGSADCAQIVLSAAIPVGSFLGESPPVSLRNDWLSNASASASAAPAMRVIANWPLVLSTQTHWHGTRRAMKRAHGRNGRQRNGRARQASGVGFHYADPSSKDGQILAEEFRHPDQIVSKTTVISLELA